MFCHYCTLPVALVGDRWVHVTPSRVGLSLRPTFVACLRQPSSGTLTATPTRHPDSR